MTGQFTPKVVTANDLLEGYVVYLSGDVWVRDLAQAEVFTEDTIAQHRLLDASKQFDIVVGVYLADVRRGANGPQPKHFREVFRATGPSNYPHGKQAERENV